MVKRIKRKVSIQIINKGLSEILIGNSEYVIGDVTVRIISAPDDVMVEMFAYNADDPELQGDLLPGGESEPK